MKWLITFNVQNTQISTVNKDHLHTQIQPIHYIKNSTANISYNDKVHFQHNLLMMNFVDEWTTKFNNMITKVIIITSWLDHTLCKSTVIEIFTCTYIPCSACFFGPSLFFLGLVDSAEMKLTIYKCFCWSKLIE